MGRWRIWGPIPKSLLFLLVSVFLLAACGSNSSSHSSSSSTVSAAALTATACAQATRPASSARTASGTLQSIDGQTLVIKNLQEKTVTATYTSATRFTQQSAVVASSLKEGTSVVVLVTSSGGTYTATTITVNNATNGFLGASGTPGASQFPRSGNNPCFTRGRFGAGGTGSAVATGTSNFRGLVGTVTQVSSSTLTITDSTGSDYSVIINPQTRIVETRSVTASSLKVGFALTVSGTANNQSVITARTVMILLKLPTTTSSSQTPQ